MPINIIKGTFKAVLDKQPGPGRQHSFYATVEVEAEVDWKVELVSAAPQGINERDKLLRFEVHKPSGTHSNAIGPRNLRYDEVPAAVDYTHATIENGDKGETVEVEIVE